VLTLSSVPSSSRTPRRVVHLPQLHGPVALEAAEFVASLLEQPEEQLTDKPRNDLWTVSGNDGALKGPTLPVQMEKTSIVGEKARADGQ
jgi:hypothetical protein